MIKDGGNPRLVCRAGRPSSEKLALYADSMGDVTHVARQLPNGNWTSKLGALEDIEHKTAEALDADYGKIAGALRRPASVSEA